MVSTRIEKSLMRLLSPISFSDVIRRTQKLRHLDVPPNLIYIRSGTSRWCSPEATYCIRPAPSASQTKVSLQSTYKNNLSITSVLIVCLRDFILMPAFSLPPVMYPLLESRVPTFSSTATDDADATPRALLRHTHHDIPRRVCQCPEKHFPYIG